MNTRAQLPKPGQKDLNKLEETGGKNVRSEHAKFVLLETTQSIPLKCFKIKDN